ncbi:MAG: rhomboid family intramembrane serine protease [Bacteroidetes bacterium]|nr:rhomboid family intramembrane serine protease [Bacteroidota bacterium]MBS1776866.1 rhomboid family intramembrane serine protease [Bacteroidota bacterium]
MFSTLALIIITCIVSFRGIHDNSFLERYAFSVEQITTPQQYYRFISSGFLHINWLHLIVNMFVLWAFGSGLEVSIGVLPYLLIYFSSMVGGNLLALIIHLHHKGYTSVGASGAIAGLVFASIALTPGLQIFFLPAWVFGIAYVFYTLYAIRSRRTDVGHAAHLGGALIGMIIAILLFPHTLQNNLLPLLGILLPGIILLFILIKKPDFILIDKNMQEKQLTIDDRYHLSKHHKEEEIDRILDKINKKGFNSLTNEEKNTLKK